MVFAGLEAGGVYWARRRSVADTQPTVVQVSTVFGRNPEYWTLLIPGSGEHHMPDEFDIIEEIPFPASAPIRQAAE
ncbi:hypothetical protein [Rhizobium sp. R693]|uniref:hypothetical protein n=1 Tax=Rhizobium sp. R693 TaxID=1764276 RepID=UPI000B52DB59|nr:hypothetical protein [Rhizobium sp. R693]